MQILMISPLIKLIGRITTSGSTDINTFENKIGNSTSFTGATI